MRRSVLLPFFGLFLLSDFSSAYIEALGANVDLSEDVHHLQVAFACDKGADYHNQFMDRNGNWVSGLESKAHCLEQSDEILKYCQQVYPHADVTNIVESIHTHVINNWCQVDAGGCAKSFTVRPYRCLTGKFQSDALLVPEQCQFDHIHNSSMCAGFYSWNSTASRSCGQHNATLRSFAMLLPCGTDMFTGVEFVCCPSESGSSGDGGEVTTTTASTETPMLDASLEQATGGKVARDSYFTRFDARGEHDAFDAARRRLDRRHKKQVATVMDDWTRLELKYEQIRRKDPQRAAKYRQRMNDRFARAMSSVKQQAAAERRQLLTVHQQRLIEHINQRKNTSLVCLVTALNQRPPHQQRVRRCLEHLLRALYSDRHHTLAHYNHLLVSEPAAAADVQLRAATITHLADVDRMVNESLAMLQRYPQMRAAILVDIDDLLVKLRQRDTLPYELVPSTITTSSTPTSSTTTTTSTTSTSSASSTEATPDPRQQIVDAETVAIQQKIAHHQHQHHQQQEQRLDNSGGHGAEAGAAVVASTPSLSYLRQPLSQLRRSVSQHWLLAAGCALTLVATLALAVFTMRHRHSRYYRRCHSRYGKADCMLGSGGGGGGFVPVAQSEPLPVHRTRPRQQQQLGADQRHIAQLRANGYENPTYKYFESK